MPFQNAVPYYVFKSHKGVQKVRVSFIFNLYSGDCENRDDLFGLDFFPSVIPVQVFGEEISDP